MVWMRFQPTTAANGHPRTSSLVSYDNGDLGAIFTDRACTPDYQETVPVLDFLGEEISPEGNCWLAAIRVDATGSVVWSRIIEGAGLYTNSGTLHSVLDGDETMRLLVEREQYTTNPQCWRPIHTSSSGPSG